MKTKLTVLVMAILLLLPVVARAESHELPTATTNLVAGKVWNYGASSLLMTRYLGSFFGGEFYAGPMSFWDVFGSRSNRLGTFKFDLAIGQKLDRLNKFNRDGGNEYDLTFDQTLKFGSAAHPVKVDVGVCYLMLTPLEKLGNDAFEEFLRFDFPIQADRKEGALITPYVEVFHYHHVGDFSSDGWFWFTGVFRNQQLGFNILEKPAVLNVDVRAGFSAGVYNSKVGLEYVRLTLGLPVQLGKGWSFGPSVILQVPGGSDRTYATEEISKVNFNLLVRKDF